MSGPLTPSPSPEEIARVFARLTIDKKRSVLEMPVARDLSIVGSVTAARANKAASQKELVAAIMDAILIAYVLGTEDVKQ